MTQHGPTSADLTSVDLPGTGTVPRNRPTSLSALMQPYTPTALHYRRNHFDDPTIDRRTWRLVVDGQVECRLRLDLAELGRLPPLEHTVLLECAGHRRTEFEPGIPGVPWGLGALSQARWAGVPLAGVLAMAGVRPGASEVVLYGADGGEFAGLAGEHPYARSLPLAKAQDPDTLLALTMNGALLPPEHGAPLRAVVPGWYAMDSVKWLVRIEVVSRAFRGPFQELDYRFQPAGQDGPGERLAALPVHALVVSPAEGDRVRAGRLLASGIAWSAAALDSVAVSLDGQAWQPARLGTVRPYQRALWELALEVPPGRHTLAVRATDVTGARQPDHPLWNKRGYANHSIHRVGFRAG